MKVIDVTAAILRRGESVLVARRAAGRQLAGYWEFPGGKVENGESPEACLQRELEEEFGIAVEVGEFVAENVHDYGDKVVRLLAYEVVHIAGEFRLTDHDAIDWLPATQLHSIQLAPADVYIAAVVASDGQ